MFVQVMRARTRDAAGLHQQMDRWVRELRPGADGFLGSTAGVTADGQFVALARFRDDAAARANAPRPEQTAWWNETAKYLDGEASFIDTTDVEMISPGGSDDAGFVQVMFGRVSDQQRYKQMTRALEDAIREFRPDFMGNTTVWSGNDFVDATYFTSEAEARVGETKEPPADVLPQFMEWRSLIEEIEYLDLSDPWLVS